MDNLFGIPLTSIMVGLLLLLGVSIAALAWIAYRQPLLVRMGLRNVVRRKAQTTLIGFGLMLSTLIVSAAFATGDTVGYSITNDLFNQLEEVDFVIGFDEAAAVDTDAEALSVEFLDELSAQFGDDPDIDGITGLIVEILPVVNPRARLSEPAASVVGVDPATVEVFRALRGLDGRPISASTLGGNRVYITDRLAEEIDAGLGDTVRVVFENEPADFEVIEVVRDTSVTASGAGNLVGGLVMHIDEARALIGAAGEVTLIGVSITGGVRDTLDLSNDVEARLDDFIAARPESYAEIALTKKELIGIGEIIGSFFVTIFLIFGLFSIAAGVLLIFLIFIMLAAERRSEMGMARAVGMSRLHLTESFLAEGMAYNLGSAAVGALLGLLVSGLLVAVLKGIGEDVGLTIAFHFNWQGFVIAYCLGVVLTFVTVVFSSWRAANLNIVRAIRDLPEPQPLRGGDASLRGLALATVGALWTVGWIVLIALGVVAGFQLFLLGLVTFGAGFLAAALLIAWFGFGVRAASRPFGRTRGWHRAVYILWWIAFSVAALFTWGLLRTGSWAGRHRNAGGWAVVMLIVGAALVYMGGWQWGQAFAYAGGATLAVLAIAMLTIYFGAATRPAFTIAALALVWYWLLPLPFSLFSDAVFDDVDPVRLLTEAIGIGPRSTISGNIEMFFVSGVSVTAAGTLAVIFNAQVLLSVISGAGRLLGGVAPAARTAIAYPLAARFRTAMTLAMFGLVVFSLVVMAFLNFNFTQLFLGDDAKAGFDVTVDANENNRLPDLREALRGAGYDVEDNIEGVGTLVSASPAFRQAGSQDDFARYTLAGADDEFLRLAELPLSTRAIGYESDEAVIEALRSDPTVAIVDTSRLGHDDFGGDPGESDLFEFDAQLNELEADPWAPIPLIVRNVDDGSEVELRIIGVIEPQVTVLLRPLFAVLTGRALLDESFGGGDVEDFFVTTVAGGDDAADEVAKGIESALLERGVQAESIAAIIDAQLQQSRAFQFLFEGFMGLGLIVGIAALGVIAFRTVVERRQQIGMLRAIGYSRRLVGLSFFFESSFIALTGIAMGLLLGGALSYNLLTSPEFTDGAEISVQVPWTRLAIISGVAYVASALMTFIPARSASRVAAAEALRYSG